MAREPEHESETQEQEPDPRPSRTSERRERKESEEALAKLSTELCAISGRRLGGLGLPETVERAVGEARRIPSPAARNRALRRVRQELRACDWTALAAKLHAEGAPRRPQLAPNADAVAAWRVRLVNEGDLGIDALVTSCPQAERKTLRVLIRNLKQATPKSESRARLALERGLSELFRVAGGGSPPPPAVAEEPEGGQSEDK